MLRRFIIFLTLILIIGASLFGIYFWWQFIRPTSPRININRAAVIKEMRELQRLETASFTIEKIIDAATPQTNKIQEFLFGDKLLLIAHGEVIAGIDLSGMKDEDIEIKGTRIRFTTPRPQILIARLDNGQTRVYDRTTGILAKGSKDLEAQAREQAELSIRSAACQGGILKQAAENARKQLTALFSALGFTEVIVIVPDASC